VYQLASLERNSTWVGVNLFFFRQGKITRPAADYIEPMTIPSPPFQEVFDQGGFPPLAVNVLAADVKGHNV
jgi:hypothetical protein